MNSIDCYSDNRQLTVPCIICIQWPLRTVLISSQKKMYGDAHCGHGLVILLHAKCYIHVYHIFDNSFSMNDIP